MLLGEPGPLLPRMLRRRCGARDMSDARADRTPAGRARGAGHGAGRSSDGRDDLTRSLRPSTEQRARAWAAPPLRDPTPARSGDAACRWSAVVRSGSRAARGPDRRAFPERRPREFATVGARCAAMSATAVASRLPAERQGRSASSLEALAGVHHRDEHEQAERRPSIPGDDEQAPVAWPRSLRSEGAMRFWRRLPPHCWPGTPTREGR